MATCAYRALGSWIVLVLLVAPAAHAVRLDGGAGVAAEYSDNIGLMPAGGEEAWVNTASVRGRLLEESANLDAEVEARAEYRDYQTDLFENETLFALDATALWRLSPERFTWALEDYFRQAPVNPFAAPTPTNRQDTNVLSTGPELRARIAPLHTAVAGARYGNFYFEHSDVDSQRYLGYLRWLYSVSPRTTVSLNGEFTNVDFMNDAFSDYDRGDGFLRLAHDFVRTRVELDAGRSIIQRDGQDEVAGFLGRIGWHTELNSSSGLDIVLLHQYTDAGTSILDTAGRDGALGTVNEQITSDLFYGRHVELAYRGHALRTSWRAAVAARDEDFDTEARDRKFVEAVLDLGYELTATWEAAIAGIHRRTENLETGQENTDRHGGLRLSYRANRHLVSSMEIGRNERESNFAGAGYTENRALISLVYERTPFVE